MAKRNNIWGVPVELPDKKPDRIRMILTRKSKNKTDLIVNGHIENVIDEKKVEQRIRKYKNDIEEMERGLKIIRIKKAQKLICLIGYSLFTIGFIRISLVSLFLTN